MVDVVQLGYQVNTADITAADTALDGLTNSTLSADRAAKQLGRGQQTAASGFKTSAAAAQNVAVASSGAAFQTANLAAQFNDIGVTLAAGQSPFTIALQQGTQISQVLNSMGGGVGVLRSLGSAFASMVNPVSLATIGI